MLVAAASTAHAQLLPLTHYTAESEPRALPSAEVHGVLQDRLGYLWIVVYSSGLVRYDGVRMELYGEADGLHSLAVWDAVEDARGHLWVGSNAGLVVSERPLAAYRAGERVRFVRTLGGVPLADVSIRRNVMAVGADGALWVGTDDLGILRYRMGPDGASVDTLATPGADGSNATVRALTARQDGSVWVSVSGSRLLRYADGQRVQEITGAGAPEQNVYTLYESPRGVLWGGERGGRLWRLDEAQATLTFRSVAEAAGATIYSIRAARDRLVVGSEGGGLLVLNPAAPSRQVTYGRTNGLLSDVVHDVTEDHEGNLWIAQSGGLSKLRYNSDAFRAYTARSFVGEPPLLPAAPVSAVWPVEATGPCPTWAGTPAGLACLHPGPPARSTYVQSADGLSNDFVNALVRDEEGRLWVGTSAGIDAIAPPGLVLPGARSTRPLRLDGEAYRIASYGGPSIVAAGAFPLRASPDTAGTRPFLWFAGYRALLALVDGAWVGFGQDAGLPATVMHAVAMDGAGHLWVGTRDAGLYRSRAPVTAEGLRAATGAAPAFPEENLGRSIEAPLFEPVWSRATGAPTDQVEALLWHEGAMWTATPAGLFVLDPPTGAAPPAVRAHLDRTTGLGSSHVFSLAPSPATGTVWIGTNAGLAEIDPETLTLRRTVTRRAGLVDNEVWYYGSVRLDAEGRVYFGTAKGLSVYDPSRDRANDVPPRLHLRDVVQRENAGGYNEVTFEWAATSFADESAVAYRTRLVGYDAVWSPPTAEAKIRYTNLPALGFPKRYTFQVLASQGAVTSTVPLSYTFEVVPPWWLRWWALLGYAAAVGLAGYLIVRDQRARLVKRMKARTQLREAEVRAERAAAHQELAEARAQALQAENERHQSELEKARELERAYAELKATQAQLVQREKLASLGELTAGIAHEIRNPLNFILNFARASTELSAELRAELGAGDGAPDHALAEGLSDLSMMTEKVVRHGERADRIVTNMLQHAREGGGDAEPVVLNRFVDEYANLAYHGWIAQSEPIAITFDRDYDDAVETVEVVAQELGRVLINLLTNAFYAVQRRYEAEGEPYRPRVVLATERHGDAVTIRVEDNGPGIPEAIRDRIFEPFFTTKPPGDGTGLGLSLAHEAIVRLHGGRLEVETEEDGGTVFRVTLPVSQASA